MGSVTWEAVWARRLARHHLVRPAPAGAVVDVVRAVGAVHAQVMPAAEVSIGIRVEAAACRDIRTELWERRTLAKLLGPRGTVHLVAADEAPLWVAANQYIPDRLDEGRMRILQMTVDQYQQIVAAIGSAVDGRGPLTVKELGEEVASRVGRWAVDNRVGAFVSGWPVWRSALYSAGRAGLVVYGPTRGSEVSYVRPESQLEGWRAVAPEAAVRFAVKRFLSAFGPATSRQFARWFGVHPANARSLFTQMGDELEEVDVEGSPAFVVAGDLDFPDTAPSGVRLLPHFDCYLVGSFPRELLAPEPWRKRAMPTGQAGTVPVVLSRGSVAGIWSRKPRSRRLEVRIEAPGLDPDLLAAEAARVAAVLELEPEVTLGPVAERRHL